MPAFYKVDKERHLVMSTRSGVLTFADLLAHQEKLLADPDFSPNFSQLRDLAHVTRVELTNEELRRLAGRSIFSPASRRAVMASSDVVFGLSRMFSAALSVTDNAAGSPQKVPLSGIGTTAKLSPTGLNFGSVTVGTTSAAKTVTLTNVGTTTLTITGIAIAGTNAGDFSQTHTCGSSLAAGASCSIRVKFKPTAKGARSAGLAVSDNAAGSPQKVALSGTGL